MTSSANSLIWGGITVGSGSSPEPAKAPQSLIATRAVEMKDGWTGQAIVEVKVEERHEKADGTKKVDLILTQVEPATTDDLEDHLRELTRTLHYNRGTGDQPTLPTGSDEPTVEAVLAAGARHKPHPFLPVDASQDNPICDVCGLLEATAVHSTQDILDDTAGDEEDAGQASDADDGWEYEEPEGRPITTIPDPFAATT